MEVSGRGVGFGVIVAMAWRALLANPLRSLLTALGVIIGVAAVVALTMVGQGTTAGLAKALESLGTNLLTITGPTGRRGGGVGLVRVGGAMILPLEDAQAIREAFPGEVVGVAPVVQDARQVKYGKSNVRATIVGTWPDYAQVRNAQPELGVFFTEDDLRARRRVAVIGYGVAEDLFGTSAAALGQRFWIGRIRFTVIGVLPDKGDQNFASPNYQVIVPLSTFLQRLGRESVSGQKVSAIFVQGASRDILTRLQQELTEFLAQRHRKTDPENYDFSILNQADALASVNQATRMVTLFLGGVAAISLLVGGIGIMNIMLVSVTERTREIGIRKALGARQRDVLAQFLVESVVLSVGGGLVGIVTGLGMAELIGRLLNVQPVFSPLSMAVAFVFAVLVGVFFGFYPAWRAAKLDPVEALRYE